VRELQEKGETQSAEELVKFALKRMRLEDSRPLAVSADRLPVRPCFTRQARCPSAVTGLKPIFQLSVER